MTVSVDQKPGDRGGPADHRGFSAADFPREPDLQCDIVMKGGITSGVVYPLAVCELATAYRLRSVGGASAGAIAAAAAAAAELGRRTVVPDPDRRPTANAVDPPPTQAEKTAPDRLPAGFLGLAQFPTLLGQPQSDKRSLLFHLFRPQRATRRLFALATGAIELASQQPENPGLGATARLVWSIAVGLAKRTWVRSLIGAIPGLALVVLTIVSLARLPAGSGAVVVVALALGLLLGLVIAGLGVVGGAVTGILSDLRALPEVGFGISSGRGETDDELALTPWLHRRLQDLAGRPYEQPVTFGELWAEGLVLQMMTTNLSRFQPMVMPWDDGVYFFDETQFADLFGAAVVDQMKASPPWMPADAHGRRRQEVLIACAARRNLRPFPPAKYLPVIVATRMSLSFPVLIAAVPLYAVDWTRPGQLDFWERVEQWLEQHQGATPADVAAAMSPEFEVNWFSDGGLTSNLPVQFFDSALPTRPTFAIDLESFGEDRKRDPDDECANSYLPTRNQGNLHRRTVRWNRGKPLAQLAAFAVALVQTARTWVDESSLVMPGYRDRVVTVYQDKEEGGLNLSMPQPVVDRLSKRGRCAASKLVDRFGPDDDGWPNQRWLRFRTATAGLSDWLTSFEHGYVANPGFYDSLLSDPRLQPSAKITGDRLRAAHARTDGLRAEIADWQADPADAFTANRPKQPPVLRLTPRTEPDVQS